MSPRPASAPSLPLDAAALWQIDRISGLALAPDGARAVCSVSSYDVDANKGSSHLWLLSTLGGAPRQLTHCGDKDGQPAWSPQGDQIAFVARRAKAGKDGKDSKDETPQLHLISPDGGEARRVSDFGPGVESFKWMPDGRRIVFAAWVWPGTKGSAAQSRQHKAWSERKETGYVTSEAYYRHWDHSVPMGRVLRLLMLDVASGRITDLFAGTPHELPRHDGGAVAYDPSPDGRRIAFEADPDPIQRSGNRTALMELDLRSRRFSTLADEPGWDFGSPRYSPDGQRLAATGAEVGKVHTALAQLVLIEPSAQRKAGRAWRALGAEWDHAVDAPLLWTPDGGALVFAAEERGRCHLWRHDLDSGAFEVVHQGGWVQGFDLQTGVLAVAADSALHPVRVWALHPQQPARRLETFNDKLLKRFSLGRVEEVSLQGARGEAVQMWLTFPAGLKPRSKHAVTHVIHGGPFAAAGDTFGYRWNPHVLANRGHVIAQVNFHGSSGFGHAFAHSLIGRQGELELQDIEAGTDWLLQQAWADPTRVFATGGSYGGFLVAWMNGHVPAWPQGRYRAYVCHAGVFDRVATMSADSYNQRPKDLAARYWEDMPRVLAQSPHAFAARMDTPTLVIHGALDYRVPDCNGLAYYNTLKARGIDARLLWFPDENHWVLKPRNSLLWYREFQDWLDGHGGKAQRTVREAVRS